MKDGIIRHNKVLFKWASCLVAVAFFLTTVLPSRAFAQGSIWLPAPGQIVPLSSSFHPAVIRGLRVDPKDPFQFNFIVDIGESGLEGDAFKQESEKLIKYFLASLAIPEKDLWVNLSPYEKDRIIADDFGATEMGRDLLAQDYLLKQITASLTHPESETGKVFWERVYKRAYELFGTTNIPTETFNKVWILPSKAKIYENGDKAFIIESHLKVMLDEDYLALNKSSSREAVKKAGGVSEKDVNKLSSQIAREVLVPLLEKEVNEGKNFAALRQVYSSFILATWFKQTLKSSILNRKYSDQGKVKGIEIEDKSVDQKIYQQYLEAYKKGVCDLMKVEFDPFARKTIPRKYFSGGIEMKTSFTGAPDIFEKTNDPEEIHNISSSGISLRNVFGKLATSGSANDLDQRYFEGLISERQGQPFLKDLFDIYFDPKSTAKTQKALQEVLLAKGYAFELNQETAAAIAYPLEGEKLGIKAIYDVPTGAHVFLKGRHFDVAKLVNPKMSETLGFEYQLVKVDGKYAIAGAQFSSGGLDFMTFKAPYSQVQLTREMLDKSAQQMSRHIGLSFQKGADIYGVSADYQSKLQSSASPLTSDSNSSDAKKYTSNRSAQDYRDNLYHAGLLDIFEFIKATIKRKGKFRYYDAGTGLGVAPTEIKILYPRESDVYGSDIDDKTIENIGENVLKGLYERFTPEEAKKYFSGKRTFRYETGDVSEKKFLDENGQPILMDLITSLYVLQYTQDPFKAWLNLFHQLADGGVFASQFLFFNDEQGLKNLATYRSIFSAMQDAGIKVQMSAPFVNEKGEISMFVSAARTGEQEIKLNIVVDAISEVEVQAFGENRTYTVYEVSYVGLGAPEEIVRVGSSSSIPSKLTAIAQNIILKYPSSKTFHHCKEASQEIADILEKEGIPYLERPVYIPGPGSSQEGVLHEVVEVNIDGVIYVMDTQLDQLQEQFDLGHEFVEQRVYRAWDYYHGATFYRDPAISESARIFEPVLIPLVSKLNKDNLTSVLGQLTSVPSNIKSRYPRLSGYYGIKAVVDAASGKAYFSDIGPHHADIARISFGEKNDDHFGYQLQAVYVDGQYMIVGIQMNSQLMYDQKTTKDQVRKANKILLDAITVPADVDKIYLHPDQIRSIVDYRQEDKDELPEYKMEEEFYTNYFRNKEKQKEFFDLIQQFWPGSETDPAVDRLGYELLVRQIDEAFVNDERALQIFRKMFFTDKGITLTPEMAKKAQDHFYSLLSDISVFVNPQTEQGRIFWRTRDPKEVGEIRHFFLGKLLNPLIGFLGLVQEDPEEYTPLYVKIVYTTYGKFAKTSQSGNSDSPRKLVIKSATNSNVNFYYENVFHLFDVYTDQIFSFENARMVPLGGDKYREVREALDKALKEGGRSSVSSSIPSQLSVGSRSLKTFLREEDLVQVEREFLRLNLTERLNPIPSVLDLLTQKAYLYALTGDRREYSISNVNPLQEGWVSTDIYLSLVNLIFKIDLVKEIAEGAKAHPDRIFRVVDWGAGEMTRNGLLPQILQNLKDRYPEVQNVQLIGFANALFPQWANVDPSIELWWGDANQFFGFIQEMKVDLVISMNGLDYIGKHSQQSIEKQKEEFLSYLVHLGAALNDSGKVLLTYDRFRSDSLDGEEGDLSQILHRFFDVSKPSLGQVTKTNIAVLQRKAIPSRISSAIPTDLLSVAQYAASKVPPGLPNGCKIASDLIAPQDNPERSPLFRSYGFALQETISVNGREHVFVDVGSWVIDTQLRQFKLPISEEFVSQFVYEKGSYLRTLWNYLDQSTRARYPDVGRKILVQEIVNLDGQDARKNESQIRQAVQGFIKEEKQYIPALHQLYFNENLSQETRGIIEDVLLEHGRALELTDKTVEKLATLDKDGVWKFKAVVDTTKNSNIVVFFHERFEESDGNIMEHLKVAQGINKNVTKTLGLKYQAQKTSNGRFIITAADFFSSSLEMWVFQGKTLTNKILQLAHKEIQSRIKIKTQIPGDGTYTVSKPLLDKLAPEEKVAFSKTGEQLEIPFAEFQEDVGGIDLDPANLKLERQGSSSPIQFDAKGFENIQIDGLYPVIITVTPIVNLPLLLGASENERTPQLSLAK